MKQAAEEKRVQKRRPAAIDSLLVRRRKKQPVDAESIRDSEK